MVKCLCAQIRPQFILSSKEFRGMESESVITPREESPLPEKISMEEDRTHDAASRTANPIHYQQAIPAPHANCVETAKVVKQKQWVWIFLHSCHTGKVEQKI